MWNKLGLKILAVSIALLLVASSVAMYGHSGTEAEKGISESGGGKGVISLMPPPFIALAGATETAAEEAEGAFPADEAGIAAYVNVNQSIDFEKLVTILDPLINVTGGVYIHGKTAIPSFDDHVDNVHPHIYANTNGWLVAYFTKDENASMLMQWSGTDTNNPNITEITTTTLEDAIEKACNATGINYTEIQPNIKYYDFEFPDADSMMIFVKTQATDGSDYIHISIPGNYMLYEASYSHYGCNYYTTYDGHDGYTSYLKVDETAIHTLGRSNGGMDITYKQYDIESTLTVSILHTIELIYSPERCPHWGTFNEVGSAGVTTVLIYKSPYS